MTYVPNMIYICSNSIHDWLINSGKMVIYVFLLGFFSPYNQKHVTLKSRLCDKKNYKKLTHNMHYIAQTRKIQKNKLIQANQGTQACYAKIIWSTLTTHP